MSPAPTVQRYTAFLAQRVLTSGEKLVLIKNSGQHERPHSDSWSHNILLVVTGDKYACIWKVLILTTQTRWFHVTSQHLFGTHATACTIYACIRSLRFLRRTLVSQYCRTFQAWVPTWDILNNFIQSLGSVDQMQKLCKANKLYEQHCLINSKMNKVLMFSHIYPNLKKCGRTQLPSW